MPASLVLRGGTVYDGTGAPGVRADVALEGDRVLGVGSIPAVDAAELDVSGLAVCPGFINVLSHAWGSLQVDGTGASDTLQGVETEVFGEAFSLGPSDERFEQMLGVRRIWASGSSSRACPTGSTSCSRVVSRRTSRASSAAPTCASWAPGSTTGA